MSSEQNDPIVRGLDQLAGLADSDHVAGRMAGIAGKARANRRRKQAVAAATLSVVAVGVAGALLLPLGGENRTAPPPAGTPTVATETTAPPSPTVTDPTDGPTSAPVDPDGLTIALTAEQIDQAVIGVLPRITGTVRGNAPSSIRVLVDGQPATGSDFLTQINEVGGEPVCEVEEGRTTVNLTLTDAERKGLRVDVSGPGTYTIAVVTSYCDPQGVAREERVSQDVTVTDATLVVTDETSVDVDGDSRPDRVRLLIPEPDRARGSSSYAVAEIARASGETDRVLLAGTGLPMVADENDLDGNGVADVQVVSRGVDRDSWTVLTLADGRVVAATPVGAGEQVVQPATEALPGGGYQLTWLREGQLVSWYTQGAWDRESDATVTLFDWVLDGGQLSLDDESQQQVCVTADPSRWTDPEPC